MQHPQTHRLRSLHRHTLLGLGLVRRRGVSPRSFPRGNARIRFERTLLRLRRQRGTLHRVLQLLVGRQHALHGTRGPRGVSLLFARLRLPAAGFLRVVYLRLVHHRARLSVLHGAARLGREAADRSACHDSNSAMGERHAGRNEGGANTPQVERQGSSSLALLPPDAG